MIAARYWIVVWIALALTGIANAGDARVFALKQGANGVEIETVDIPDGQAQVFICGVGEYIDLIYPPAPGMSAGLVINEKRVLMARNVGGQLSVTEDFRGKKREMPALEDAENYEIRVCVIDSQSRLAAFIVSGGKSVERDDAAPVMDLFAGKVPVPDGNFIVSTDTYVPLRSPRVYGEAELTVDQYLFVEGRSNAAMGLFVVDLGASSSVVVKSFLPADARLESSTMVQHTPEGAQVLDADSSGLTGVIKNLSSHTTLSRLRVGNLEFSDATVGVMPELPKLAGHEIVGILGLDLMRSAEYLSLAFNKDRATLRLSQKPEDKSKGVVVPFACTQGHLFIRSEINGKPLLAFLDSGMPRSGLLDAQAAKTLGIEPANDAKEVGGLDGGKVKMKQGVIPLLKIGAHTLKELPIEIGAPAVFDSMRTHDQSVGLFGNDLLRRFQRIDIDFVGRRIRLTP